MKRRTIEDGKTCRERRKLSRAEGAAEQISGQRRGERILEDSRWGMKWK